MRPAAPIVIASLFVAPAAAGEPGVSSGFGLRSDPFHGQRAVHRGVDLRAAAGTPVLAAASGIIRVAGWRGGYGLMVEIVHPDATATRYAHLSRIDVRPAQSVARGEPIGKVGHTGRATGSHLHFEYRIGGTAIDPIPYFSPLEADGAPAQMPRPVDPHRSAFAAAREGAPVLAGARLPDGRTALRRLIQ